MSRTSSSRLSQLAFTLLAIDLFAVHALAALDKSLAMKFYKTPRSFFASGETNKRDLEKNWVRDYSDFSYLVQRERRKFWVKAASVARDLQLSQHVFSSRTQKNYKVLQTAGASILGQSDDGKQEWLPLSELRPLPQDTGVAMALTNTQLREEPNWKSESLLNLPAGSRLKVIQIEETWAKVSFESVGQATGWVDLNNLLFKHDFAAFILTEEKKWIPVLYREGPEMITSDKKKIPLGKVTALLTKPELGISLVTDDSENLLLRQNLTLLKTDFQIWGLSKVDGHGEVFWKKQQRTPAAETEDTSGITFEELMKREIVSVSVHPKNPNAAIVSAHGIFITQDGKFWKQLPQFGQQNFPVLVDDSSHFYVGPQRSLDGGKTFSHYFRWESLAPLVEKKQRAPIQQLRVKNLTSPRPGILRLEVETTRGALALAARVSQEPISKWDFD